MNVYVIANVWKIIIGMAVGYSITNSMNYYILQKTIFEKREMC